MQTSLAGETQMEHILNRFALASTRAPGRRGFDFLGPNDAGKLETFFLSFDFDQRREYFGGGVSARSILEFCRTIDWTETTIIARSGPYCLEAIAMITALRGHRRSAELSMACPLSCDRRPIVTELLDLALVTASLSWRELVVDHELAMPELLSLLRTSTSARFTDDVVRIDVPIGCARVVAC
jgi:hypothetical protein